MFNEYKSEITERPSTPDSIIKMWVLLEGSQRAVKLKADLSETKDLDDFALILKREFEELEKVRPQDIVFLDSNNTSIRPGIDLKSLSDNSTDENPLVVRYPLTNANVVVNYSYRHKHGSTEIPHTSGSLSLLKEVIKEKYEDLETKEFYFLNDKTEIRNEYNFNTAVSQTLDGKNCVFKLKVIVKGKKSYSEWDLKDVFKKILGKPNYEYLSDIPRFNLNRLPSLTPPFTEGEIKKFVEELQQALNALNNECDNESMARLYINAFMKSAVCYIKDHINESTQLCVEKQLDGSYGYGPVDYMVKLTEILVLLCEAKSEDMNKGVAQVVVQMQSAIENLGKRKRPVMFGIVTTSKLWRFVRWTGSLEEPTVHISVEYACNFKSNMEPEKEVLKYIARVLQAQATQFGDGGHSSKRQCTDHDQECDT
ncbi:7019_t:CDS:2 [Diversispora eburnea]|uniref:7019_t:CDS:1 n=1 Tax=Diversispora eburnea TaxID=1213867 RepID=A0A9N9C0A3_9GLOM|nr:7019_t:CDS:2 [Diversispora eburnea]